MPDVWIAGCQSCRLSDVPNFAHPLWQIALWIDVSLIFKNKSNQGMYLVCTSPKPSGNDHGKRSINVGVTNHSSWNHTVGWAPKKVPHPLKDLLPWVKSNMEPEKWFPKRCSFGIYQRVDAIFDLPTVHHPLWGLVNAAVFTNGLSQLCPSVPWHHRDLSM